MFLSFSGMTVVEAKSDASDTEKINAYMEEIKQQKNNQINESK